MMFEERTMKDAEMDSILSKQDEIQPSSGFAASVMEAVRREATAPPPIPFPWKRAWPMLALAAAALAVLGRFAIVELSRGSLVTHLATSPPPLRGLIPEGGIGSALVWTALALLTAFVSLKLSMRLAGGRA